MSDTRHPRSMAPVQTCTEAEQRMSVLTSAGVEGRIAATQGSDPALEALRLDIRESWSRCVAAGLDPARPPARRVESSGKLRELNQRHGLVRRLAIAEMNALHHQIAGSNFVIAFATPGGI